MAHGVISKVNARLKFSHRNNRYLTPNLSHLLYKTLIDPHFDYGCSAWYPNLSKNLKTEFKLPKNSAFLSVYSWLKWQIYWKKNFLVTHYRKITSVCKFHCIQILWWEMPLLSKWVFIKAPESNLSLRNSYHKLKQQFCRTSTGQKASSSQTWHFHKITKTNKMHHSKPKKHALLGHIFFKTHIVHS